MYIAQCGFLFIFNECHVLIDSNWQIKMIEYLFLKRIAFWNLESKEVGLNLPEIPIFWRLWLN